MSFVFAFITFLFGTLKVQHMLMRHNPSINTFVDEDAIDAGQKFSIEDQGDFMMAFQVTTWLDGPKNDPYFVKWMAILWIYEENEYRTVFIPTYECTQKDMERLYPPAKMNMMVEELK